MLFRTHIVFGFLIGLLLIKYLEIKNQILFIILILLFSMLPDIDETSSKIGKKLKPLSWPINFIFGHRGLFHSIFTPLTIYLILYTLNLKIIGLAILLGYFSHIFLDSLTKKGIRPLYPLKTRIKGFIKTGSLMENIIFLIFLTVSVYLLISL